MSAVGRKGEEKPKGSSGAIFTTNFARAGRLRFSQEHHARLPSTMGQARKRAERGSQEGLVVTCGRQTAGRGRFGRTWQSPVGNLYATLLLRPAVGVAEAPQLGFVASLALAEGLSGLNDTRILIKWPNDLLTSEGKIAGLLLEAVLQKDAPNSVAALLIGFGVNLVEAPVDEGGAVFGTGLTPQEALTSFLQSFAEWYETWQEQGFAPIREAWLARTFEQGAPIQARLTNREVAGAFCGIDEAGHLLLQVTEGGKVQQETIRSADVWWHKEKHNAFSD